VTEPPADRASPPADSAIDARLARWFAGQGWQPFEFQREVWAALAAGASGLLHASTGAGKTHAAWIGALSALLAQPPEGRPWPLSVLWITPMRALAADTLRALAAPVEALDLPVSLGLRSGDTPSAERARQDRRLPTALVTTPESLCLLLSREDARARLGQLRFVVVDEWHELIANKRGVQVQLALARLAHWCPRLAVWGLSATLGNLDEAAEVLCAALGRAPRLVRGKLVKDLQVDTLLPLSAGHFPWGGHLGLQMLGPVVDEIERASTCLVFTNTRSQAELWFQQLLQARPDWAGVIALHHGSLDREVREWVELGLKEGRLKAVVATSSLDLGVDFAPVERVLQIGSAKGVARLLQRAGRSGHAPGRASRISLVPTHALELVEAAAARRAVAAGRVESRSPPERPLDALVQHMVTVALGGGFEPQALYDEVRRAYSYRGLTRAEFDWALDFVGRGGAALAAYPDYRRVAPGADGLLRVPDRKVAQRHRMNVGTIVSDASMQVAWLGGGRIGTIEESFIARLRRGDCFLFGGKLLEFVRTQDMTAYVRRAQKNRGAVPRWGGSKMPLSNEMADALLATLARADQGDLFEPELQAVAELLAIQRHVSALPTPDTLLIEHWRSREGHHLYLYPFGGRHVHIGLASLLAWRLARERPNTFSISVNDYGFELLSVEPVETAALADGRALAACGLLDDVLASLNSSELAQRRFREIARVSGLVFGGYPGAPRSSRQLQASSSLFFEVFRKYDPSNRLLAQAEAEVLAQELELGRLRRTLAQMRARRQVWKELQRPSPFAFPLLVERLREKLSTERLGAQIERLLADMERAATAVLAAPMPAGSSAMAAKPRPRRPRSR
jgi:ATP-dependent Lhr-like helicase